MVTGKKNTSWIERSFDVFPGGSLGEFNLPRELSTVLSHGKGSRIYDVFGREYIDYSLAWGSTILGHAHPAIAEAVKRQLEKGGSSPVRRRCDSPRPGLRQPCTR